MRHAAWAPAGRGYAVYPARSCHNMVRCPSDRSCDRAFLQNGKEKPNRVTPDSRFLITAKVALILFFWSDLNIRICFESWTRWIVFSLFSVTAVNSHWPVWLNWWTSHDLLLHAMHVLGFTQCIILGRAQTRVLSFPSCCWKHHSVGIAVADIPWVASIDGFIIMSSWVILSNFTIERKVQAATGNRKLFFFFFFSGLKYKIV